MNARQPTDGLCYGLPRADLMQILASRAVDWEALRGKSLFITGGTGFFGQWLLATLMLANQLQGLDLRVAVLSRRPQRFLLAAPWFAACPGLSLVEGDVRDFAFPARHYDFIVHGATTSAEETYRGEPPLRKFDTLVQGTRHVLDFARHCGAGRMLFLSSGAAYGSPPADGSPIAEDYVGQLALDDTTTALAQAKRAAEFLCHCHAEESGLSLSIARCFAFVGPLLPLDLHYAVGNFLAQARRGEGIVIKGDGSDRRSYMYPTDLIPWLLAILQRGASRRVYNVGSDQAVSIRELAQLASEAGGGRSPVRVLGQGKVDVGNIARSSYVPSVERAHQELGLRLDVTLPQALRRTMDWLEAQPG